MNINSDYLKKEYFCSNCGGLGTLVPHSVTEFFKGSLIKVEFSVCNKCGTEVILPEQIKRNDQEWKK